MDDDTNNILGICLTLGCRMGKCAIDEKNGIQGQCNSSYQG